MLQLTRPVWRSLTVPRPVKCEVRESMSIQFRTCHMQDRVGSSPQPRGRALARVEWTPAARLQRLHRRWESLSSSKLAGPPVWVPALGIFLRSVHSRTFRTTHLL